MKRIGRYEIQSEIGRGGFGEVFRAYDPTVGRYVAVKALHAREHPEMLLRFRSEAAAAGRLRHRNIVVIHDFGEQDQIPYIVMEYLEGSDLERVITGGPQLSLFQKLDIISQAAAGLYHAHQNGIVHRDVKPANLMLLGDGTVKIMDFGIALLSQAVASRITPQDAFIGTFAYMAPEQFYGAESDALTDLFALGVTSYKLLTGNHPFAAPEMANMMHNIMNKTPDSLRRLVPACPEALENVVFKMLAKERDARYQSLEDVKLDLHAIISETQSDRVAQLVKEGIGFIRHGELAAAQSLVRQALEIDPANKPARELREQLQRLVKERELRPQVEALVTAGKTDLEAQRYEDALHKFESALRLDKSNQQIVELIRQARSEWDQHQRADRLVKEAGRSLELGELTAANRGIRDALTIFPAHIAAKALSAEIDQKIAVRQKEASLRDGLSQARGLLVLQSFDPALELLQQLHRDFPESREVLRMLDSATRDRETKLREDQLRIAVEKVKELIKSRRFAEAKSLVAEHAREFPESKELSDLGSYAAEEDRSAKRATLVDQVSTNASGLIKAGKHDDAVALLKKTLEEHPSATNLRELLQSASSAKAEVARNEAIRKTTAAVSDLCAAGSYGAALDRIASFTTAFGASAELDRWRRTAEEELDKQKRVASVRKLILQAYGLIEEGRGDSASQILQQATVQGGNDAGISSLIEDAQVKLREKRKALDVSRAIAEADELANDRQFEAAVQLLDRELARYPGESSLLRQKESILARKADYEKRVVRKELLEKIFELRAAGQLEVAWNLLESDHAKSLANDPEYSRLKGQIRADLEAKRQKAKVQHLAEQAEELVSQNDFLSATKILEGAVADYPTEPRITRLLAFTKERQRAQNQAKELETLSRDLEARRVAGDFPSAENMLAAAAAKYPDDPLIEKERRLLNAAKSEHARHRAIADRLAQARTLLTQKKPEQAYQVLAQAIQDFPEEAEFVKLFNTARQLVEEERKIRLLSQASEQASALLRAGNYSDALACIESALQTSPADARLLALKDEIWKTQQVSAAVSRADDLRVAREFDQAQQVVEEALRQVSTDRRLTDLLARIQSDRATQTRNDAIAKVIETGKSLLSQQRTEDALSLLNEAAQRYPDVPAVSDLRRQAQNQLQLELSRKSVETTKLDAQALIANGQFERAIQMLEATPLAANELSDLLKSAREGLRKIRQNEAYKAALALCDQGHFTEAQDTLQRAVLQYGSTPETVELQQRLDNELKGKRLREARERDLNRLLTLENEVGNAAPRQLKKALREVDSHIATYPDDKEIAEVGSRVKLKIQAAIPPPSAGGWKIPAAVLAAIAAVVALFIALRPNPVKNSLVTVEVRTDPAGASIRLGTKTCVTPNCGFQMQPGEYPLEASLQGYQPLHRSVTLQAGAQRSYLDFTLEPAPPALPPVTAKTGTLLIKTGQPRALIFIDDKPQARTGDNGSSSLELATGMHDVRVEKLGFKAPETQRTAIVANKNSILSFQFTAQNSGPQLPLNPEKAKQPEQPQPPVQPPPIQPSLEAQDWQKARTSGDASLLRSFLQKYPATSYKPEAQNLLDDMEWSQVNISDSKALSSYLSRYPAGRHAQEANTRLADLAWMNVDKASEPAIQQFIGQFPESSHRHEAENTLADIRKRLAAQQEIIKEKPAQIDQSLQFGIDAALAQLNLAFKNRQPKAVKKIWPDIPAQYTEAMRLPGTTFTMALTPVEKVILNGQGASVSCDLQTSSTIQGKTTQAKKRVKVELRRSSDGWIIADVV